ncbi:COX15/CtaA family protein [Amylibacter sp.]|jgi:cytochrome c oxidase assembly protein subunit 15|nr:COX15/CtaA family protein [Amylibacter sp.]MDA9243823.1 COX15/CtaA family protein [Amylibacter sp.]MDA9329960.1 COX15/CtaA family protein [Amylibacter sp.]MDA9926368.1 COX15/CtaA family protein [Amylibacter sp.]MDB4146609.1 COX15/CtaA family protein [Amylibacter sp.]|tara:strand:- start:1731 stop:2870 length:1140 start_codon:yes stop_codon:yes gene_type:complete
MNKSRNIFEDVDIDKPNDTSFKGGYIDQGRDEWRLGVSRWMKILFILVFLMVLVGGLTRLTDSGLSITEWNVIKGAIPPLSDIAWALEFDKYKNIPEYQLQNKGMSLGDFKVIYWWEWGHRQLGRFVGLVWLIGFVYLNLRKKIPNEWKFRMLFVGLLGGLQGAIGWWMVSSGLVGRMVDVASYRLATHLGLAFIILGTLFWFVMRVERTDVDLMQSRRRSNLQSIRWTSLLLVLSFWQILLGALVAGIDAGRGYIDWPMMNGEFLPSESFDYNPLWTNFFENPALVQFNHRILGYVLMALGIAAWFKSRSIAHRKLRIGFKAILIMMVAQMVLGIVTVMYAAPWYIAIFHQIGAVVLIVLILQTKFIANFPQEQSVRS